MDWEHIQRPTHEFADGRIITYRSNWEINYSFYLEWLVQQKQIKSWEYEPERLKWMGGSYLPDFKVNNNDGTFYYVEVKGHPQGIRKYKRAKKENPKITFELVDSEAYRVLKRQVGKMLNFL